MEPLIQNGSKLIIRARLQQSIQNIATGARVHFFEPSEKYRYLNEYYKLLINCLKIQLDVQKVCYICQF